MAAANGQIAVTGALAGDVGQGPVIEAAPLRTDACGELLPGPLRQPLDQGIDPHHPRPGGDLLIAGDREEIADLAVFQ